MTAAEWASIIGLFGVMWSIALAPLFVPLFVAIRAGRDAPRRWLFVLLATVSAYGFLGLFSVVIWLPLEFLASRVAAQAAVEFPHFAGSIFPLLNDIYPWVPWAGMLCAIIFAIAFTRYFWRRWPRIVAVL